MMKTPEPPQRVTRSGKTLAIDGSQNKKVGKKRSNICTNPDEWRKKTGASFKLVNGQATGAQSESTKKVQELKSSCKRQHRSLERSDSLPKRQRIDDPAAFERGRTPSKSTGLQRSTLLSTGQTKGQQHTHGYCGDQGTKARSGSSGGFKTRSRSGSAALAKPEPGKPKVAVSTIQTTPTFMRYGWSYLGGLPRGCVWPVGLESTVGQKWKVWSRSDNTFYSASNWHPLEEDFQTNVDTTRSIIAKKKLWNMLDLFEQDLDYAVQSHGKKPDNDQSDSPASDDDASPDSESDLDDDGNTPKVTYTSVPTTKINNTSLIQTVQSYGNNDQSGSPASDVTPSPDSELDSDEDGNIPKATNASAPTTKINHASLIQTVLSHGHQSHGKKPDNDQSDSPVSDGDASPDSESDSDDDGNTQMVTNASVPTTKVNNASLIQTVLSHGHQSHGKKPDNDQSDSPVSDGDASPDSESDSDDDGNTQKVTNASVPTTKVNNASLIQTVLSHGHQSHGKKPDNDQSDSPVSDGDASPDSESDSDDDGNTQKVTIASVPTTKVNNASLIQTVLSHGHQSHGKKPDNDQSDSPVSDGDASPDSESDSDDDGNTQKVTNASVPTTKVNNASLIQTVQSHGNQLDNDQSDSPVSDVNAFPDSESDWDEDGNTPKVTYASVPTTKVNYASLIQTVLSHGHQSHGKKPDNDQSDSPVSDGDASPDSESDSDDDGNTQKVTIASVPTTKVNNASLIQTVQSYGNNDQSGSPASDVTPSPDSELDSDEDGNIPKATNASAPTTKINHASLIQTVLSHGNKPANDKSYSPTSDGESLESDLDWISEDYLDEAEDDRHEAEPVPTVPTTEINSEEETQFGLKENSIERDVTYPGIYMRKHQKSKISTSGQAYKKKSDRVYNNYHCCCVCQKMVQHIPVHMKTHKRHPAVKEEMGKEKPDFKKLRILGDDLNNRKVLESKKGEIIVSRRGGGKLDIGKYGPCPICREWVLLNGLKKHYRKCGKKKVIHTKDLILQSRIIAGHISNSPSKMMQNEVLKSMKRDEIGELAQKDKLIMALGESWLKRNVDNVAKRRYYASSHMRLCGKLLNSMQEDEDDKKEMWDLIDPKDFDKFVNGALNVSLPLMDDIEDLQAPSNAIKLKYDIRRLVNAKYAYLLKAEVPNTEEMKKCKRFLMLMELELAERVTKQARSILERRKLDQKKELPTPDDIERLTRFLMDKLAQTPLVVDQFPEIVRLCQVRLLVYNKRRSGELEVISLQNYASKQSSLSDLDESVSKDLTAVEQRLLRSQELMTVRGKGGRPVPVIIPADAVSPLAFIASRSVRTDARISPENNFLFPNSVNGYIRAYQNLRTVCDQLQLSAPGRITSVAMRKYTATLSQLMNLDKYQMDWVCKHLGHTKNVHREAYRQMSGLVERVYITKLMLVQDHNLTGKYKGADLHTMDVKDLVFEADSMSPEEGTGINGEKQECVEDDMSAEEVQCLQELENSDVYSEEEDTDTRRRKPCTQKMKAKRTRWSKEEHDELKQYFQAYMDSRICPRSKVVEAARKRSQESNGQIWKRTNDKIIKKISAMNHK